MVKVLDFFFKFAPVYFSEEIHEILLTQWEYGIWFQILIYGKNEPHGAQFEWHCKHFGPWSTFYLGFKIPW